MVLTPLTLFVLLVCNMMVVGFAALYCRYHRSSPKRSIVLTVTPAIVALFGFVSGTFGNAGFPADRCEPAQTILATSAVIVSMVSIVLSTMTVTAQQIFSQSISSAANFIRLFPDCVPYRYIRHPLSSACLLALIAALLASPRPDILCCLLFSCARFSVLAGREEQRLAGSAIGKRYCRYLVETGRFFPKVLS